MKCRGRGKLKRLFDVVESFFEGGGLRDNGEGGFMLFMFADAMAKDQADAIEAKSKIVSVRED
jgi:hypothetical protein